ncbi:hypothetical protein [Marinactinospora rubrisoli]|uniref:Uncharacterized protein n=1 Tax=Marinactinospora rubrisoli TaxID=2715399 RepID=A0ABW2KES2_9ACTN
MQNGTFPTPHPESATQDAHYAAFLAIAAAFPTGYHLERRSVPDGWEYTVRTPDGIVHTRWRLADVQRILAAVRGPR